MDSKSTCKFNIRGVVALVLVMVTLVTSIIPAEAAADTGYLMEDLFTASSYRCFQDNVHQGDLTDPVRYFNNAKITEYEWSVTTDHFFGWCYFTVFMYNKPKNMQVKFYTNDVWNEAEYIDHYGNIYQYRVWCGKNNSEISVRALWSTYTGNFAIYSFVGQKNVGEEVKHVDVYNQMVRLVYATATIETYPFTCIEGINVPSSVNGEFNTSTFDWKNTITYIDIDPRWRSYNHISDVSFLLSGVHLGTFEISVVDDKGVPVYVVTPEVSIAYMRSSLVKGENDYPYSYYQITADLSDYDLTDLTIRLSMHVDPFNIEPNRKFIWYSIDNVIVTPYIEDIPWYKTFWNWLSSKWDSVTSNIRSSIGSAADKIVNAFNGNSAQNEAMNQAGQAMSDQANSMNQAQDQLNSVDKPSVSPDNLFGNILSFDTGGLRILSAITSNSQVTSMLVVVFTFALCGYIFFGKKG